MPSYPSGGLFFCRYHLSMIAALSLVLIASMVQGEQPPLPQQLKQIEFLRGKWEGVQVYSNRGSEKAVVNLSCIKDVGNRYYRFSHSAKGMGFRDTAILLTFDTSDGKYKAWLFNSVGPGAVEMSGDLKGKDLILTTKLVDYPSIGKAILKTTWTNSSEKELLYKLEMKKGDNWVTAENGQFNRLR